jgi:hypothetical protein
VKKYEINKYSPALFKQGRFLREDWTACSDIGRVMPHGRLDLPEYLRVETRYVDAVMAVAQAVAPDLLQVHNIEFVDAASERLTNLGLADVFDGTAAPAEGERVTYDRLDNLVRRCLREVAWLELVSTPKLLIHFGYDMRLIIASSLPLTGVLDQIRASGLFVYDSEAGLPTLDAWLA